MDKAIAETWQLVSGTNGLRTQLLDQLTDADLSYTPGGQAMTLGALFREFGEIEQSYIDSLTTLTQKWDYRNNEAGLEASSARLKAWFQELDGKMQAALEGKSAEDLQKTVDRGGFSPTIDIQLQVYVQALLIFLGKATVYFRIMNKPLPDSVQSWIG